MILKITSLVCIVFIASLLQSSTGYGFSIIGTPFLLLLYPAHTAIQINIVLSIALSVMVLVKIKDEIDRRLVMTLIKGSVIGSIGGIFIYLYMDVQGLKLIVGTIIIVLTGLLIADFTMRQTKGRSISVGGISGMLTTSIGVPGPPLLLYFSGTTMNRYTLRSTTLAYYLFIYTVSFIMQIMFGSTNKEVWLHSLIAVPALFGGIVFGRILLRRMNMKTFRIITFVILIFTGLYLIATSLW